MEYAYFCSQLNTFNLVPLREQHCILYTCGSSEVVSTPWESHKSGDEARQAKLILLVVHVQCYSLASWILDLYLWENPCFILYVVFSFSQKTNIWLFDWQVANGISDGR